MYTLEAATPTEVAGVIKSLLPKAEVATDAAGGRVVVVASQAQHALLQRMLQQFDTSPAADRQLEFYAIPDRATDELQSILKVFVPKATIQLQADPRRLMVIASPSDQKTVKRLLEQLSTTATEAQQKSLRVYSVTAEQRRQFVATYQQLAPQLKTIAIQESPRPNELQVLGDQDQQQRVAKLLEDLKQQFPDEPRQLKFYDVPAALRGSIHDAQRPARTGTETGPNRRRRSAGPHGTGRHRGRAQTRRRFPRATPQRVAAGREITPRLFGDRRAETPVCQFVRADRDRIEDDPDPGESAAQ